MRKINWNVICANGGIGLLEDFASYVISFRQLTRELKCSIARQEVSKLEKLGEDFAIRLSRKALKRRGVVVNIAC